MKKLSSILVISFLCIASVMAQSADELVQKHLDAIGGAQAWKKLSSIQMKTQTSFMGMELPGTVYIQTPNKMRSETIIQDKAIVMVYDGKEAWSLNPLMGSTKAEKLPESSVEEFQKQADLGGPLVDYTSKGSSVELLGEDELDGTEVYKLNLKEKDGTVTTFYIDKESYMILKSATRKMSNGQEVEGSSEFSDYREVEGLKFPFTTIMGTAGQTMTSKVVSIELNKSIEAKLFTKPE
jgi:outer membrane lipoprotein-sorting protein